MLDLIKYKSYLKIENNSCKRDFQGTEERLMLPQYLRILQLRVQLQAHLNWREPVLLLSSAAPSSPPPSIPYP